MFIVFAANICKKKDGTNNKKQLYKLMTCTSRWYSAAVLLSQLSKLLSDCILSICNICLFPVLVLRAGLPFDRSSSCSLFFYYFYRFLMKKVTYMFALV